MIRGQVSYEAGIGYHIKPEGQSRAVVSFPEAIQPLDSSGKQFDYEKLPAGFNLGDVVRFVMAPDGIHASTVEKDQ